MEATRSGWEDISSAHDRQLHGVACPRPDPASRTWDRPSVPAKGTSRVDLRLNGVPACEGCEGWSQQGEGRFMTTLDRVDTPKRSLRRDRHR